MASKNTPQARENDLVVQELENEVLIYDLKINKAYCLNETAAAIWNLCDGRNSVSDISRKLSSRLQQPVADDLVYLALDQFKTDDLLSKSGELEIKFGGLSRREAIRKVGFATMVALPVISSLIAPTAAMAQSSGGCNGTIPAGGTTSSATSNVAELKAQCQSCCYRDFVPDVSGGGEGTCCANCTDARCQ